MRSDYLLTLSPQKFRRATGVEMETYGLMVESVREERASRRIPGRPSVLSIEDQVLMFLRHLRRNDTYFDLGIDYGLEESTAFKIIERIEQILFKLPDFQHLSNQVTASTNQEAAMNGTAEPKDAEAVLDDSVPSECAEDEITPGLFIVDATETAIIRAEDKEQQQSDYSGKKRDPR